MRIHRAHLFIIIFLAVEILSSFYVYDYTTRDKRPVGEYTLKTEAACFDATYTGGMLAVGGRDGSVSLIQRGRLITRWVYYGGAPASSVKISASGDYLASGDEEGSIALLSYVPIMVDGRVTPLWMHRIPGARLEGIYSMEGMPPLVYVLVSSGGRLILMQTDGSTVWEFSTGAESVRGSISFDGSWVAAVDSLGEAYFFNTRRPEPLWTAQTELRDASLAVSLDGRYVVVGGEPTEGGGAVSLLSLTKGEKAYSKDYSRPVEEVGISSSGERVFARLGDGSIAVLKREDDSFSEKLLNVGGGFASFAASPFGSYFVGATRRAAYFYYLPREGPLWSFETKGLLKVATSQNGDIVFLCEPDAVHVFSNTEFSEFPPGSRPAWGVIFSSTLVGLTLALLYGRLGPVARKIGTDLPYLVLGFSVGGILGFFVTRDYSQSILLCGLSAFVGCLASVRGKGFDSLLSGCVQGLLGAMVGGLSLGLIIWCGGDERSIFQLLIENTANGVRLGLLFGSLGAAIGLLVTWRILKKGRSGIGTPRLP
jgi:hypothetical protein